MKLLVGEYYLKCANTVNYYYYLSVVVEYVLSLSESIFVTNVHIHIHVSCLFYFLIFGVKNV